jgi:hypothetical protein
MRTEVWIKQSLGFMCHGEFTERMLMKENGTLTSLDLGECHRVQVCVDDNARDSYCGTNQLKYTTR